MCDTRPNGPRIRLRRPWWAVLMLGLGWLSLAAPAAGESAKDSGNAGAAAHGSAAEFDEAEGGDEASLPVPAGDRPTRAPADRDCGFRMPLYEHTVEPGEHLGTIAGRYGVRHPELVVLNPQLEDPNLIRPGE